MLKASRNKIVYLDLTVIDDQGQVVETTDGSEAFCYVHGRGNLLPAIESLIENQQVGFECKAVLQPEQAFGEYYPELQVNVARQQLSLDVMPRRGEVVQTHGPNGVMAFKIEEIYDNHVKLNANHPLAGKALMIYLKVLDVTKPHKDEVRHGRPHPAGHHLMVVATENAPIEKLKANTGRDAS